MAGKAGDAGVLVGSTIFYVLHDHPRRITHRTEYAGISLTTTLFTPMIAPSPTVTPFMMNELCPIQA